MADCFTLPNAAELVKQLRFLKKYMRHTEINELYSDEVMAHAADAIEQLVSKCNHLAEENAKLKAERDAAVADLKSLAPCRYCKHFGVNPLTCDALEECLYGKEQMWEWRGIKENADA